ncbi:MAG: hypothetical protein HY040_23450 [Planctomycetes bacterium]|nr:hypothetical protein [Planctomycetota bacterium]
MSRRIFLVLGFFSCFLHLAGASDRDASRDYESRPVNDAVKKSETPAKSDVVIRYLDKKVNGLSVAETPHFRILHDQDKKIVETVGKVAESSRVALQKKWFGDVSNDWDGKCSIYLHGSLKDYTGKTGQKNALGHMRTLDWAGMFARSIHVPALESNMATDVLPHEVCHSVMAARFQGKTPRWADEGMALLSESPVRILEFQLLLAKYHKEDALFSLEVLMNTKETEHMDTLEYYAQSLSLVKFLCDKKGNKEFTDFIRTCIQKGYEPALKESYGIQGYGDLERQWQEYAFRAKKKNNE